MREVEAGDALLTTMPSALIIDAGVGVWSLFDTSAREIDS